MPVWKLEDTWVVSSLLPPYGHVGPGDCTQIVRLDSKCFLTTEPSLGEGMGRISMYMFIHAQYTRGGQRSNC